MKKNKNHILLLIVIFSHVFGFYFLSTAMVSLRTKSFSDSTENSFDLLKFVKRRKEKDYITSSDNTAIVDAETNDTNNEEIQKSTVPFFKYLKLLYRIFTGEQKRVINRISSIPSKFLVSSPAFNVDYHRLLI